MSLRSRRDNLNQRRHSEGVSPKNLLLSSRWIFGPGLVSGLFQDLLLSSSIASEGGVRIPTNVVILRVSWETRENLFFYFFYFLFLMALAYWQNKKNCFNISRKKYCIKQWRRRSVFPNWTPWIYAELGGVTGVAFFIIFAYNMLKGLHIRKK